MLNDRTRCCLRLYFVINMATNTGLFFETSMLQAHIEFEFHL